MPLIDTAADAFRKAFEAYTVQSDSGDYREDNTYHVLSPSHTKLGEGSSFDDATAMREQFASRAAVIAVIREIVFADMLSRAAFLAGCDLRKFENNKVNQGRRPSVALLNGLLTAIEQNTRAGELPLGEKKA